jgi:hypothetical protein
VAGRQELPSFLDLVRLRAWPTKVPNRVATSCRISGNWSLPRVRAISQNCRFLVRRDEDQRCLMLFVILPGLSVAVPLHDLTEAAGKSG